MTSSILIVGSGFAGIGLAIKLKQAGIEDFLILEQGDQVGGTWRDNTYPGAACDVESQLYSFSFEPNPFWSRAFSPQTEILAYLKNCVARHGLESHLRLNTEVVRASFNESTTMWELTTDSGQRFRAPVFVSACGGLARPALPDIKGLSSFSRKMFHSARWDHTFNLKDKKVGVIGTGASAIQSVPAIAPSVEKLLVFQRTAPWILPKPDFQIDAKMQRRFEKLPLLQKVVRAYQYFRHEALALGFISRIKLLNVGERFALKYLKRKVSDPELRRKLTPTFKMGCKRVLLSKDYFPAIQRENVSLMTCPIQEITSHGVITTDGIEHELDALVLATGFHAAESVAPFEIIGRHQRTIAQAWQNYAQAYLGTTVAGFPNLFLIVGPNTGLGHSSMVYMIESQIAYIIDALAKMKQHHLKSIEVKPEVQDTYNKKLQNKFPSTIWASGCISWYQTKSGVNTTLWPGYTFQFRWLTRKFNLKNYQTQAL